jgi:TPR repeat protein
MVDSGSASAAVVIGATYDPNMLDALGGQNLPPDIAKARLWYQRAHQMGAPESASLLERLGSTERRPR